MKDLSDYQHFVGCDVSKDTLDFAIYQRGTNIKNFPHIKVSNTVEGYREMKKWLRTHRIDWRQTVIGMEHTGLYSTALGEWCHKYGLIFTMLHPADVARSVSNRGRNKTDKDDAQLIADYVYTQREKLSPSSPEPAIFKKLRLLQNERKLAVNARTAYKNQLYGISDHESIKRMHDMIKTFDTQIKCVEKRMMDLIRSDEKISRNYDLLESIPGIGLVNIVATIVATANFTRFQTSRQYAKFICVSPLSRESGTSVRGGDHVSVAGHTRLKALLTQAAKTAIINDPQMKAYYQRKRGEGKAHGCVLNAVKFKMIGRMFAVINRQKPYVEQDKYKSIV